jgi:flagellar FliJ protein
MYRFRLEALLNHRRHQQEVLQKQLADAQKKLANEQQKLRIIKREKLANAQLLRKKQKESNTVTDILIYVTYIEKLSKNIKNQHERVQEAGEMVTRKRNELMAAMKKRKALEKLKEKGWQAFQQSLMTNERKLMDEVASTRHARKM